MLVDLTISHLAATWELRNGVGDYWWVSVLRALTGASKGDDGAATQPTIDPQNVRWM